MTVVAGYQKTAEGDAAIVRAVAEARLRHTELVVLVAAADEASVLEQIDRSEIEHGGDTEAVVPVTVRHTVRTDDYADELIELATEVSGELIVIGLRKRSPVGKMLLGSIAQSVLLNAHVPVLAVRA